MDDISEPFRPTLRTQADLERAWRHLMGPLGFSGYSVWLMLVDADDRPLRQLMQVEDARAVPDADGLASFAFLCDHLLADFAPDGRVALLLSRPGSATVTARDRAWARGLLAACADAAVRCDVVHLATDTDLVPLPYDALAGAA